MKPKLLVVELWGIGDLAIATPFLRAASEKYSVTVLSKPFAMEMQQRLWPGVTVVPFVAPWTAFKGKYRLLSWPWIKLFQLIIQLRREKFDVAVSARWDPRDHFLLWLTGAKKRLGFPRLKSGIFLTEIVESPLATAHRYSYWRNLASALGIILPPSTELKLPAKIDSQKILVHTGAAQPTRIWPLVRFKNLVAKLRNAGNDVQVLCDPPQTQWWIDAGEKNLGTPTSIPALLKFIDDAGIFIGNDSGPGHLAAICGCTTFTILGPTLPEWFLPLHPQAEFAQGKACPYKPCFDYCRFPAPHCLLNVSEEEVWLKVEKFIARHSLEKSVAI
jgi:ADP-heptose:LPS heptosyltransferase